MSAQAARLEDFQFDLDGTYSPAEWQTKWRGLTLFTEDPFRQAIYETRAQIAEGLPPGTSIGFTPVDGLADTQAVLGFKVVLPDGTVKIIY